MLLALIAVPSLGQEPAEADFPAPQPIDIGLTEEAEVRRLFIDVEAKDGEGRPIPRLTLDDFRIRLNYVWRKIQSVDDLCPCTNESEVLPAARDATEDLRARLAEIDTRFVLYFDFAQLRSEGRAEAFELARRWVQEVMQPGDEAMVVVHASGPGLRQMSPFTSVPEALMQAIAAAESDTELHDPFPDDYLDRLEKCRSGTVSCYNTGRKDYVQQRRSFWALLGFLTRMDSAGGRKALLLFHQNATMFPGRMYPGRDSEDVPDLIDLVQEVGAAATSSRTEIHALVMSGGAMWTVNFGANVADGSGGSYNRNDVDVFDALSSAGRGCRCIYRIGVVPPTDKTRVYRVKVKARGQALPSRYRVHHRSAADRWAANAMAVLNNPGDAWDLQVGAALIPLEVNGSRWSAKVQVAVDLSRLPEDVAGEGREWEVGALLAQRKSRDVQEMLGYLRLAPGDPAARKLVVHERVFEDLPPGPYEVRAYVRDRRADLYGGTRITLDLPNAAKRGGVAGPMILRLRGDNRVARLPLRERLDVIEPMQLIDAEADWAAADTTGLAGPGEALRFSTWVCDAAKGSGGGASLNRWIALEGERQLEFEDPVLRPVRGCTRIEDELAWEALAPGEYEYCVDAGPSGGAVRAAFRVSE